MHYLLFMLWIFPLEFPSFHRKQFETSSLSSTTIANSINIDIIQEILRKLITFLIFSNSNTSLSKHLCIPTSSFSVNKTSKRLLLIHTFYVSLKISFFSIFLTISSNENLSFTSNMVCFCFLLKMSMSNRLKTESTFAILSFLRI